MLFGLRVAVEAMALSDIAGTGTIQPNGYDGAGRRPRCASRNAAGVAGYTPNAIVVNPVDWETIELALSSVEAVEHLSLPFDPAARRLWGVAVVVTNAQTEGVAHTLSQGSVGLNTDTLGVSVQWSEASNRRRLREEPCPRPL